jgi:hypothetical protein
VLLPAGTKPRHGRFYFRAEQRELGLNLVGPLAGPLLGLSRGDVGGEVLFHLDQGLRRIEPPLANELSRDDRMLSARYDRHLEKLPVASERDAAGDEHSA